jgi:hypothetical protein
MFLLDIYTFYSRSTGMQSSLDQLLIIELPIKLIDRNIRISAFAGMMNRII